MALEAEILEALRQTNPGEVSKTFPGPVNQFGRVIFLFSHSGIKPRPINNKDNNDGCI